MPSSIHSFIKPWIFQRALAACLAFVLFFTQVLFANTQEKSLWEERRKPTLKNQQYAFLNSNFQALNSKQIPISKFQIPNNINGFGFSASDLGFQLNLQKYGTIREIANPKSQSSKSKTIIHIQDIHGHPEAQKNIEKLILKILSFQPDALVGLEGGAGDVPLEDFRLLSQETNQKVSAFLRNANIITGAESAGLVAPRAPRMVGIEDKGLYLKNVAAVKAAWPLREKALAKIEREKIELNQQKKAVYSPPMLALDEKQRAYQEGEVGLGDYLTSFPRGSSPWFPTVQRGEEFRGDDVYTYPNVSLFLQTWALEKSLDFALVERQRNQFLSHLVDKITKSELSHLTQQSLAFRSGRITYPAYYRLLHETAAQAGVPLSTTPEFDRYITYVLQADAIQVEEFLAEVARYEKEVWSKLCETEEQRRVYQALVRLGLTEKLVKFTLTPGEWEEYKMHSFPLVGKGREGGLIDSSLKTKSTNTHLLRNSSLSPSPYPLPQGEGNKVPGLQPFKSFYSLAESRNAALSSNFKNKLTASASKTGILVTGGFHSDALTDLLAKENHTVITVTPKLTNADAANDNEYLSVFTRDKTPLEKLFEAPKISLPKTLALLPAYGKGLSREQVARLGNVLEAPSAEQLGKEVERMSGGDEEQKLALLEALGWVRKSIENGKTMYRATRTHPWAKEGAVYQTRRKILLAPFAEWWFSLPALIPSTIVIAILYLAGVDFIGQLVFGFIAGVIGLRQAIPYYKDRHKATHSEAGWKQIRLHHVAYAAISLVVLLAGYRLLPLPFTLSLISAFLGSVFTFLAFHFRRDIKAAFNAAVAPMAGAQATLLNQAHEADIQKLWDKVTERIEQGRGVTEEELLGKKNTINPDGSLIPLRVKNLIMSVPDDSDVHREIVKAKQDLWAALKKAGLVEKEGQKDKVQLYPDQNLHFTVAVLDHKKVGPDVPPQYPKKVGDALSVVADEAVEQGSAANFLVKSAAISPSMTLVIRAGPLEGMPDTLQPIKDHVKNRLKDKPLDVGGGDTYQANIGVTDNAYFLTLGFISEPLSPQEFETVARIMETFREKVYGTLPIREILGGQITNRMADPFILEKRYVLKQNEAREASPIHPEAQFRFLFEGGWTRHLLVAADQFDDIENSLDLRITDPYGQGHVFFNQFFNSPELDHGIGRGEPSVKFNWSRQAGDAWNEVNIGYRYGDDPFLHIVVKTADNEHEFQLTGRDALFVVGADAQGAAFLVSPECKTRLETLTKDLNIFPFRLVTPSDVLENKEWQLTFGYMEGARKTILRREPPAFELIIEQLAKETENFPEFKIDKTDAGTTLHYFSKENATTPKQTVKLEDERIWGIHFDPTHKKVALARNAVSLQEPFRNPDGWTISFVNLPTARQMYEATGGRAFRDLFEVSIPASPGSYSPKQNMTASRIWEWLAKSAFSAATLLILSLFFHEKTSLIAKFLVLTLNDNALPGDFIIAAVLLMAAGISRFASYILKDQGDLNTDLEEKLDLPRLFSDPNALKALMRAAPQIQKKLGQLKYPFKKVEVHLNLGRPTKPAKGQFDGKTLRITPDVALLFFLNGTKSSLLNKVNLSDFIKPKYASDEELTTLLDERDRFLQMLLHHEELRFRWRWMNRSTWLVALQTFRVYAWRPLVHMFRFWKKPPSFLISGAELVQDPSEISGPPDPPITAVYSGYLRMDEDKNRIVIVQKEDHYDVWIDEGQGLRITRTGMVTHSGGFTLYHNDQPIIFNQREERLTWGGLNVILRAEDARVEQLDYKLGLAVARGDRGAAEKLIKKLREILKMESAQLSPWFVAQLENNISRIIPSEGDTRHIIPLNSLDQTVGHRHRPAASAWGVRSEQKWFHTPSAALALLVLFTMKLMGYGYLHAVMGAGITGLSLLALLLIPFIWIHWDVTNREKFKDLFKYDYINQDGNIHQARLKWNTFRYLGLYIPGRHFAFGLWTLVVALVLGAVVVEIEWAALGALSEFLDLSSQGDALPLMLKTLSLLKTAYFSLLIGHREGRRLHLVNNRYWPWEGEVRATASQTDNAPDNTGLAEIKLISKNSGPKSVEKIVKIGVSLEEMGAIIARLVRYRIIRSVSSPSISEWQEKRYGGGGFPDIGDPYKKAAWLEKHLPDICTGSLRSQGVQKGDLFIVSNIQGYGDIFGEMLVFVPHDDANIRPGMPLFDINAEEERINRNLRDDGNQILNRLSAAQKKLLDDFLATCVHIPNAPTLGFIRKTFARVILGDITPKELAQDLEWLNLNHETSMHLFLQLLMTGKSPEVRDSRPVSLEQRVQYFGRQRAHLTPAGLSALEALEAAARTGGLERVADLLPSVESPRLEYFLPLSMDEETTERIRTDLASLRITQGCSRGCSHCYFSPSRQVKLMPFYRILGLLDVLGSSGVEKLGQEREGPDAVSEGKMATYYDTESFDYYDPLYDADFGDVLKAILTKFPLQEIHVTTRGWYLGDKIGPRAAKKIAALLDKHSGSLDFRISFDLYDIKGDEVRYVIRFLKLLEIFKGREVNISTTDDKQNRDQTKQLNDLVRSLARHTINTSLKEKSWVHTDVSRMGRARKKDSKNRHDVGNCMYGCHLLPDGRVLHKVPIPPINNPLVPDSDVVVHRFDELPITLWSDEEAIPAILPSPTGAKRSGFFFSGFAPQSNPGRLGLPVVDTLGPSASAWRPRVEQRWFHTPPAALALLVLFTMKLMGYGYLHAVMGAGIAGFVLLFFLLFPFIWIHWDVTNREKFKDLFKYDSIDQDGNVVKKRLWWNTFRYLGLYIPGRHFMFGLTTLIVVLSLPVFVLGAEGFVVDSLNGLFSVSSDTVSLNGLSFIGALISAGFALYEGHWDGVRLHVKNNREWKWERRVRASGERQEDFVMHSLAETLMLQLLNGASQEDREQWRERLRRGIKVVQEKRGMSDLTEEVRRILDRNIAEMRWQMAALGNTKKTTADPPRHNHPLEDDRAREIPVTGKSPSLVGEAASLNARPAITTGKPAGAKGAPRESSLLLGRSVAENIRRIEAHLQEAADLGQKRTRGDLCQTFRTEAPTINEYLRRPGSTGTPLHRHPGFDGRSLYGNRPYSWAIPRNRKINLIRAWLDHASATGTKLSIESLLGLFRKADKQTVLMFMNDATLENRTRLRDHPGFNAESMPPNIGTPSLENSDKESEAVSAPRRQRRVSRQNHLSRISKTLEEAAGQNKTITLGRIASLCGLTESQTRYYMMLSYNSNPLRDHAGFDLRSFYSGPPFPLAIMNRRKAALLFITLESARMEGKRLTLEDVKRLFRNSNNLMAHQWMDFLGRDGKPLKEHAAFDRASLDPLYESANEAAAERIPSASAWPIAFEQFAFWTVLTLPLTLSGFLSAYSMLSPPMAFLWFLVAAVADVLLLYSASIPALPWSLRRFLSIHRFIIHSHIFFKPNKVYEKRLEQLETKRRSATLTDKEFKELNLLQENLSWVKSTTAKERREQYKDYLTKRYWIFASVTLLTALAVDGFLMAARMLDVNQVLSLPFLPSQLLEGLFMSLGGYDVSLPLAARIATDSFAIGNLAGMAAHWANNKAWRFQGELGAMSKKPKKPSRRSSKKKKPAIERLKKGERLIRKGTFAYEVREAIRMYNSIRLPVFRIAVAESTWAALQDQGRPRPGNQEIEEAEFDTAIDLIRASLKQQKKPFRWANMPADSDVQDLFRLVIRYLEWISRNPREGEPAKVSDIGRRASGSPDPSETEEEQRWIGEINWDLTSRHRPNGSGGQGAPETGHPSVFSNILREAGKGATWLASSLSEASKAKAIESLKKRHPGFRLALEPIAAHLNDIREDLEPPQTGLTPQQRFQRLFRDEPPSRGQPESAGGRESAEHLLGPLPEGVRPTTASPGEMRPRPGFSSARRRARAAGAQQRRLQEVPSTPAAVQPAIEHPSRTREIRTEDLRHYFDQQRRTNPELAHSINLALQFFERLLRSDFDSIRNLDDLVGRLSSSEERDQAVRVMSFLTPVFPHLERRFQGRRFSPAMQRVFAVLDRCYIGEVRRSLSSGETPRQHLRLTLFEAILARSQIESIEDVTARLSATLGSPQDPAQVRAAIVDIFLALEHHRLTDDYPFTSSLRPIYNAIELFFTSDFRSQVTDSDVLMLFDYLERDPNARPEDLANQLTNLPLAVDNLDTYLHVYTVENGSSQAFRRVLSVLGDYFERATAGSQEPPPLGAHAFDERQEQWFTTIPVVGGVVLVFLFLFDGMSPLEALINGFSSTLIFLAMALPFFIVLHIKVFKEHPEYFSTRSGLNVFQVGWNIISYTIYIATRHAAFGLVTLAIAFIPVLFAAGLAWAEPLLGYYGAFAIAGLVEWKLGLVQWSFTKAHEAGITVHKGNNNPENGWLWRGTLGAMASERRDKKRPVNPLASLNSRKGRFPSGTLTRELIEAAQAYLTADQLLYLEAVRETARARMLGAGRRKGAPILKEWDFKEEEYEAAIKTAEDVFNQAGIPIEWMPAPDEDVAIFFRIVLRYLEWLVLVDGENVANLGANAKKWKDIIENEILGGIPTKEKAQIKTARPPSRLSVALYSHGQRTPDWLDRVVSIDHPRAEEINKLARHHSGFRLALEVLRNNHVCLAKIRREIEPNETARQRAARVLGDVDEKREKALSPEEERARLFGSDNGTETNGHAPDEEGPSFPQIRIEQHRPPHRPRAATFNGSIRTNGATHHADELRAAPDMNAVNLLELSDPLRGLLTAEKFREELVSDADVLAFYDAVFKHRTIRGLEYYLHYGPNPKANVPKEVREQALHRLASALKTHLSKGVGFSPRLQDIVQIIDQHFRFEETVEAFVLTPSQETYGEVWRQIEIRLVEMGATNNDLLPFLEAKSEKAGYDQRYVVVRGYDEKNQAIYTLPPEHWRPVRNNMGEVIRDIIMRDPRLNEARKAELAAQIEIRNVEPSEWRTLWTRRIKAEAANAQKYMKPELRLQKMADFVEACSVYLQMTEPSGKAGETNARLLSGRHGGFWLNHPAYIVKASDTETKWARKRTPFWTFIGLLMADVNIVWSVLLTIFSIPLAIWLLHILRGYSFETGTFSWADAGAALFKNRDVLWLTFLSSVFALPLGLLIFDDLLMKVVGVMLYRVGLIWLTKHHHEIDMAVLTHSIQKRLLEDAPWTWPDLPGRSNRKDGRSKSQIPVEMVPLSERFSKRKARIQWIGA